MQWPWQRKRDWAAELEREREQHFQHLMDLIDLAGMRAIQFGNVGERVWPEQLEQFRQIAHDGGHDVFVVTGAGRVHGVYGVET